MVGGSGVRLDTESGVREAELFLALRVTAGRAGMGAQARVSMASAVEESWLEQGSHAHAVTEREEVIFDERRGAAQGVRRRVFVDLVLRSSTRGADPDPELVEALLATEADRRFDQVFMPTPEAQQLMARIMLAARLLPGPESWPDLSDAGKRKLLAAQCVGRHSFRQLKEIPWAKVLAGLLTHRQTRQLERELPQMITVPSGRQVALDYLPGVEPDCGPVLAVKLQEMFGLAETPKLCQGKLPLTLHLLAPNGRPAQITRDLRSFWNSSYALVRKDLRGRYPKHPWPEDPWSAKPSARTKRKP